MYNFSRFSHFHCEANQAFAKEDTGKLLSEVVNAEILTLS